MTQVQGTNNYFENLASATSKALDVHSQVQNHAELFQTRVATAILTSAAIQNSFIQSGSKPSEDIVKSVRSLKQSVRNLTNELQSLYGNYSKACKFILLAETFSLKNYEALVYLQEQKPAQKDSQIQNLEIITQTIYPLLKTTVKHEMTEVINQLADLETIINNLSSEVLSALKVDVAISNRLDKTNRQIPLETIKHNQSTLSQFQRSFQSEKSTNSATKQVREAESFVKNHILKSMMENEQKLQEKQRQVQLEVIKKQHGHVQHQPQIITYNDPGYSGPIIEEIEEESPQIMHAPKPLALTYPIAQEPAFEVTHEEKAPEEAIPTMIIPTIEENPVNSSQQALEKNDVQKEVPPNAETKRQKPRMLSGIDTTNIIGDISEPRKTRKKTRALAGLSSGNIIGDLGDTVRTRRSRRAKS